MPTRGQILLGSWHLKVCGRGVSNESWGGDRVGARHKMRHKMFHVLFCLFFVVFPSSSTSTRPICWQSQEDMIPSFADLQAHSNTRAAEAAHSTTEINMDDAEGQQETQGNSASDDGDLGDNAGATPRGDLTAGVTTQFTRHYPLPEGTVADVAAFQQVPSPATSSVPAESKSTFF